MKIYVVMGETGEYADYQEWIVHAYVDPTEAQKHADAAQQAFCSLVPGWNPGENEGIPFQRYLELGAFKNPYDPDGQLDYTGVRYGVVEVPVSEKFR